MVFHKLYTLSLLFTTFSVWPHTAKADCNSHSPAFPIPVLDGKSKFMRNAHKDIEASLRRLVSHQEYATTSFSVAVTTSSETLFEVHHTAKERDEARPGAATVNGTTCYRIASLTKSFTALALMQQEGNGNIRFTDYINKYIAELNEPQSGTLPWPEINIWSLATGMAGIPNDLTQPYAILDRKDPQSYGVPPLTSSQHFEAHCESKATNGKSCTRADLIAYLKPLLPIFPPKQQSTYSNIGFELLGLALENITSTPYENLIQSTILNDIGMSSTSFATPPDSVAALPKGQSWYWPLAMGIQNPTGGLYSSTDDLSKFIRYILTHYNGITLSHNWISPVSFGTGTNTFIGLPWEIFRTDKVLPYTKRPVTFVTKSGSLPGYTSYLVTVPEYNFGFSILTAGNPNFAKRALEIVGTKMVRHADGFCHHNLATKYTGTWAAKEGLNSSITISHSRHNNLYIERWISNGTDILSNLASLGFPYASSSPNTKQYLQLVPTFLFLDQPKLQGEVFRAIAQRESRHGRHGGRRGPWQERHGHHDEDSDEDRHGVFDDLCVTNIDQGYYAGLPINEIGFWDLRSQEEGFGAVEITGLRVKLDRVGGHGDRKEFLVQEL